MENVERILTDDEIALHNLLEAEVALVEDLILVEVPNFTVLDADIRAGAIAKAVNFAREMAKRIEEQDKGAGLGGSL